MEGAERYAVNAVGVRSVTPETVPRYDSDGEDNDEQGGADVAGNRTVSGRGANPPIESFNDFGVWLQDYVQKGSNIISDEAYDEVRLFLQSDAQKGAKGQSGDAKFRHAVRKKKYHLVTAPQLGLHDVVFTLNDQVMRVPGIRSGYDLENGTVQSGSHGAGEPCPHVSPALCFCTTKTYSLHIAVHSWRFCTA